MSPGRAHEKKAWLVPQSHISLGLLMGNSKAICLTHHVADRARVFRGNTVTRTGGLLIVGQHRIGAIPHALLVALFSLRTEVGSSFGRGVLVWANCIARDGMATAHTHRKSAFWAAAARPRKATKQMPIPRHLPILLASTMVAVYYAVCGATIARHQLLQSC